LTRLENTESKSMRIIIPIIVTAVVCLGGAFLLLGNRDDKKPQEPPEETKKAPRTPPEIYDVGEFLVNVNSADELRYLRVQIAVSLEGYGDEEAAHAKGGHGGGHGGGAPAKDELPKLKAPDEAIVRDVIVRVLSANSYEQLRADGGHGDVKEQLRSELEETLDDCEVEDVLFLSFVMQ